jgi:hypothetical protein
MEALRKIVPGSALAPLFSLPPSSSELQYEVIVLPFLADNDRRDDVERKSLTACLRGTLGDAEFNNTRCLMAERGTAIELFN